MRANELIDQRTNERKNEKQADRPDKRTRKKNKNKNKSTETEPFNTVLRNTVIPFPLQ